MKRRAVIGGLATLAVSAAVVVAAAPADAVANTISGTVTFRGQPLAGAEVWAFADVYDRRGPRVTSRTLTDSTGRYSMPAPANPAGPGHVCVYTTSSVPGWAGSTLPTCYGATATRSAMAIGFDRTRNGIDISVQAAATATGTVVRTDGTPATGPVWVELRYANAAASELQSWGNLDDDPREVSTVRSTLPDAQGRYQFDGLAPGRYELRLNDLAAVPCLPPSAPSSFTVSSTSAAVSTSDLRLPGVALGTLRVHVAPAKYPREVTIMRAGDDCAILHAKGGTKARTVRVQVPPGTYTVHVTNSYRIPATTVIAGRTADVGPTKLTPARRLGAIEGRFAHLAHTKWPTRVPVYGYHGRQLAATIDGPLTGRLGRFTVKDLPPGRYLVGPAQVPVRVKAGRTTKAGNLPGFPERAALQGKVLGSTKPTMSVTLQAANKKTRTALSWYLKQPRASVASSGKWRMPSVPPGKYRVVVSDSEITYPFFGVSYVEGRSAATARVITLGTGATIKHLRVHVSALPTPT